MLQGKNVLLGVTGGIAAYKACALTSKLTQEGADVQVMMTENATKLVNPQTFQALSRNPVFLDTFHEPDPRKIAHIDIADRADIVILAPATANILGKLAGGISDDMVSTTLLATQAPVYIAPAMNVHMYQHPAVMENMQKLERFGYHFIEPGDGYLACGYVGKGRLEEPQTIIETVNAHQEGKGPLSGKHVLVSAGPTQEKIDSVRFFTNHSSGKMGFALAEQAAAKGATVTLVAGPVHEEVTHPQIDRRDVVTAEDMLREMSAYYAASDIVIKAAAVADYRPSVTHAGKLKKSTGSLEIEMERTTDILQTLGEEKSGQFLVGFAAEAEDVYQNGLEKLQKKHLDAIVINNIQTEGAGFGSDTNIVTYVNKDKQKEDIARASKAAISDKLLELIIRDTGDGAER